MLKSVPVSHFGDLVAVIALASPGTQNFLDDYTERRDAEKGCGDFIHPLVDAVADDTHGIPIFQEQIVAAVKVLAGFDSDRAESFRRNAGRMLTPEIEAELEAFRSKVYRRHPELSQRTVEKILGDLMCYAPYTYPKRLATEKAMTAYAAAYRKIYHELDRRLIVASLEEHCSDCRRELGEDFEQVHIWLDELFRILGPKHRSARHHTGGVEQVRKIWGDRAAQAAEIHIRRDCGGKLPDEKSAQMLSLFGPDSTPCLQR